MNNDKLTNKIMDKQHDLQFQIQDVIESKILPILENSEIKTAIKKELGMSLTDQTKLIESVKDMYYESFRYDVALTTIWDVEIENENSY